MKTFRGKITLFVPEKLYGFAKNPDDETEDVFFHVADFRWGDGAPNPPPVLGEDVEVEYDPDRPMRDTDSAHKARRVERINEPKLVEGVVDRFDMARGYGFVKGNDKVAYFLHRSDVEDGQIPVEGDRLEFYAGFKRNKPRAVYAKIMRGRRPAGVE